MATQIKDDDQTAVAAYNAVKFKQILIGVENDLHANQMLLLLVHKLPYLDHNIIQIKKNSFFFLLLYIYVRVYCIDKEKKNKEQGVQHSRCSIYSRVPSRIKSGVKRRCSIFP